MNSNMTNNQEIDLKDLLFAILYKWKKIIGVGIAFAILLGGIKGVSTYRQLNSAETVQSAQEQYKSDLELYESNIAAYEREIQNLTNDILNQQKYLQNSVLMNASPYDVYEASADLFIKTDYEIMPSMMYQNVDYTDTIMQVYQSTLSGTSFLENIADKNNMSIQYLKELVTIERGNTVIKGANINKLTNLLTVRVKHMDEKQAEQILEMVLNGIDSLQQQITMTIGEHTVTVVNAGSGTGVDYDLANKQKDESQRLTMLQASLDEKEKSMKELKEPDEPAPPLLTTLKRGIKYGVFGGGLGGFTVAFFSCLGFIMSDNLYAEKDIRNRFSIKIIGKLLVPGKKVGKIDTWLRQLEGRYYNVSEAESFDLIAENICNYSEAASCLLITGHVSKEYLELVKIRLQEKLPEMELISGMSVLKSADTLKKLVKCDAVVMVEEIGKVTYTCIGQEVDTITDMQKKLVGCIVFE